MLYASVVQDFGNISIMCVSPTADKAQLQNFAPYLRCSYSTFAQDQCYVHSIVGFDENDLLGYCNLCSSCTVQSMRVYL